MTKKELMKKGLIPGDPRIKDYTLYSKGNCHIPKRFYDYILLHNDRPNPYNMDDMRRGGWIKDDLNNIINRFDGISFEYLKN